MWSKLLVFVHSDGLIRPTDRLNKSNPAFDEKFSILLLGKHPVVVLLLRKPHYENYHECTEYVSNCLQQRYCTVGLRNALRKVETNCVTCRKFAAQTLQPLMADLPKERTEDNVCRLQRNRMLKF